MEAYQKLFEQRFLKRKATICISKLRRLLSAQFIKIFRKGVDNEQVTDNLTELAESERYSERCEAEAHNNKKRR